MKNIWIVLICITCFSCSRKNEVENIFLENLKESNKDFNKDIEQASFSIENLYFETRQGDYKESIQKLKLCRKEIEKSVKEWNSMNSDEILENYKGLIEKLNSYDLIIIFEKKENSSINLLPKQVLIEYLKNKLYKPLLNNYIRSLGNNIIGCGYFIYSKKGLKSEIEKVEKEKQDIENRLLDLKRDLENFDPNFSYK